MSQLNTRISYGAADEKKKKKRERERYFFFPASRGLSRRGKNERPLLAGYIFPSILSILRKKCVNS